MMDEKRTNRDFLPKVTSSLKTVWLGFGERGDGEDLKDFEKSEYLFPESMHSSLSHKLKYVINNSSLYVKVFQRNAFCSVVVIN